MATTLTIDNRALVRIGSGLQLQRTASPFQSGTGPVRRVLRVGVCGTDLQIQRGVRSDRAAILGHEGIAVRLNSGSGARERCEIFNPVDPDDQDVILGHSHDGLLQDYLLHEIPSHRVVPAHGALPLDLGPLVEPTATALYAWELMRPRLHSGASVAIFGGGSAGLLLAMLGEDLGYRIQVVHPRRERRRFLQQLDVLHADAITDSVRTGSVTGAVVCVPREAAFEAVGRAIDSLAADGVLDLFGGIPADLRHPGLPAADLSAVRRTNVCGHGVAPTNVDTNRGQRLWLTGHRGTSAIQLGHAQQHLLAAPARYARVITQVVSLDEAAQRIPAMAQRDRSLGEYAKVVVDATMAQRTRSVDLHTTVADQLGGA
ncbi:hypothetical protein [Nocardia wallacei]|uniref:hypothetical protein n=1 Tax=Nocardia wallacei TaxID=480035 RepID=UPI00245529D0|nr:hypothetical protein [Nocardia wallacei]